MRAALILLILASQLFTIRATQADDPFTAVQKELPCRFDSFADIKYELHGKLINAQWTHVGGFVIVAGKYIVTNHHIVSMTPWSITTGLFHILKTRVTQLKIIRQWQELHFCDGSMLSMARAQKLAENSTIDYVVYELSDVYVEQHSLPVPILNELYPSLELKMAGTPGGFNILKASRSGYAFSLSYADPTRVEIPIKFDLGDSGQPVFTTRNNKLYLFALGVENFLKTLNGIVIPFPMIAEDVLKKTKIDLIASHDAFLAAKQPVALAP